MDIEKTTTKVFGSSTATKVISFVTIAYFSVRTDFEFANSRLTYNPPDWTAYRSLYCPPLSINSVCVPTSTTLPSSIVYIRSAF